MHTHVQENCRSSTEGCAHLRFLAFLAILRLERGPWGGQACALLLRLLFARVGARMFVTASQVLTGSP